MVSMRMIQFLKVDRLLAMVCAGAVALSASQMATANDAKTKKAPKARTIRVGDPGRGGNVDEQLERLSAQLDQLQAELDRVREALADVHGGPRMRRATPPPQPGHPEWAAPPAPPEAGMPPMPAMPPMPPLPAMPDFAPGEGPDGAPQAMHEWQEQLREMQERWREQQQEMTEQWREHAREWQDRQREMAEHWRERGRELAQAARERAKARGEGARERRQEKRNEARAERRSERREAQQDQVVYGVSDEQADQLYELLAPGDVTVVVSRAGDHIAVRGSQEQHQTLNAALQLLGWIDRDATFERMREGEAQSHKYRVGRERAATLYDMLSPNEVKVVVARAGNEAVSISGTPREHEVIKDFLELLNWSKDEE